MRKTKATYGLFKGISLAISIFFLASTAFSQKAEIQMKLDTNTLLIGEQTHLHIHYSIPRKLEQFLPIFNDTLTQEIEIIEQHTDTITQENPDYLKLHYDLLITSFDSGYHVIPPQKLRISYINDSTLEEIESNALLITVNTIPINLDGEIKDIKGIIEMPLKFGEIFYRYILPILILLLVIAALFYVYLQKKRNQPIFKRPPKPLPPAHEEAIAALHKLEAEKLWQKNEYKAYYSSLTDILRRYAERRYDFPAQEMVSSEIIGSLKTNGLEEQLCKELDQYLSQADLVKFAKLIPLGDECAAFMSWAIQFVEKTKTIIKEEEDV
jgi:hypothetical protein